jgi:hypothetical protein
MILRLLKGRGIVSGLFEKKRDAIPPHHKHWLWLSRKMIVCRLGAQVSIPGRKAGTFSSLQHKRMSLGSIQSSV